MWQDPGRDGTGRMKSSLPPVPMFSRSKIQTQCLSVRLRDEHSEKKRQLFSVQYFSVKLADNNIQAIFHCQVVAPADMGERLFYLNLLP